MPDDDYFSIGPEKTAPKARHQTNDVAEGPGYVVRREEDGLWLYYVSGQHGGEECAILIDDADAEGLRDGSMTLDDVLIRHGAY